MFEREEISKNPPIKTFRKEFLEYFEANFKTEEALIIGKSMLGEEIIAYKIGRGKRHILCVGAHHAAEYITSSVLYDFILFLLEKAARGASYNEIDIRFLLQKFTFWVMPCLNPDGVDLNILGISDSPLRFRQLRMNDGSLDFSSWQANARGVDLNHNYSYRFYEYKRDFEAAENIQPGKTKYSGEYPESEPESSALAGFVRALAPSLVLSLHTQGEEIYSISETRRARRIASAAAKITGYKLREPSGSAGYGGFCDYTGAALGIPSVTIELGRGKNPLPFSDLPSLILKSRKLLVALPTVL